MVIYPLLLLGLMASLSPVTIVVFILLLRTNRARVNAFGFLVGWGVSLAVVIAASYAIGSTRASQRGSGGTAVSVAVLLLGLFLLVLAIRVAAEFVAPMILSLVLTLAVVPLGAGGHGDTDGRDALRSYGAGPGVM